MLDSFLIDNVSNHLWRACLGPHCQKDLFFLPCLCQELWMQIYSPVMWPWTCGQFLYWLRRSAIHAGSAIFLHILIVSLSTLPLGCNDVPGRKLKRNKLFILVRDFSCRDQVPAKSHVALCLLVIKESCGALAAMSYNMNIYLDWGDMIPRRGKSVNTR